MSLTREQYDEIVRSYMQKQNRNHQLAMQRRDEIFAKIPEFRELTDMVPVVAMGYLRSKLGEGGSTHPDSPFSLRPELEKIAERKKKLLLSNGFPADYLDEKYDCPLCRDTGFVDGHKCRCFRQKEIEVLYDHSHLQELVKEQNFDTLSERYYKGEDLQRFRVASAACRRMAAEFDEVFRNIYLYGTVGTGKTFLSICIARELLESCHSVLYFSAAALFDKLSMYAFDAKAKSELRSFTQDLYGCDLLIIDDLGTELTNQFISAQLFSCLNERFLNRRSTVISTNLSLGEMQQRYSDRVFSRITNNYELYKLTGNDIRLMKSRLRSRSSAGAANWKHPSQQTVFTP
ncbi:MAG: ATP-binding protein [Lachnospiraceae bacterium]|nr:ATP-binding protein [Lachnospiraceae bacterium]